MRCLWDTNIVSEYIKRRNPYVLQKAAVYLNQYPKAEISLFTRYEVLRGLNAIGATRLQIHFERFCQDHIVLDLTEPIMVLAADLWGRLSQRGQLIGDNDPIIAATALHHGMGLATGNGAHFSRIPGLVIEDWTRP